MKKKLYKILAFALALSIVFSNTTYMTYATNVSSNKENQESHEHIHAVGDTSIPEIPISVVDQNGDTINYVYSDVLSGAEINDIGFYVPETDTTEYVFYEFHICVNKYEKTLLSEENLIVYTNQTVSISEYADENKTTYIFIKKSSINNNSGTISFNINENHVLSYSNGTTVDNSKVHTETCTVCGQVTQENCTREEEYSYVDDTLHKISCIHCGQIIDESEHEATKIVVQEATCTEAGTEKTICAICYCDMSAEVAYGPLTHNYIEDIYNENAIITKETCTTDGEYYISCEYCKELDTNSRFTVEATGHDYSGECETDENKHVKKCKTCSIILVDEEHDFILDEATSYDSTCSEYGLNSYYCSYCNYKKEEQIEKKSHEFTEKVMTLDYIKSESTCVDYDIFYYACKNCGTSAQGISDNAIYEDDTSLLKSHNFVSDGFGEYDIKREQTCTLAEISYKKCSVCDVSAKGIDENATFISKESLGHNYITEDTPSNQNLCSGANCTSPSKYYKICSRCSTQGTETYEYGLIGTHNYESMTISNEYLVSEATCTQKATYYFKCTGCDAYDENQTYTVGSALGHDLGEWEITNTSHKRDCNRCHTVITSGSHYYKETTVQNDDGSTSIKNICSICSHIKDSAENGGNESHTHDFSVMDTSDIYLRTKATCVDNATYFYKCSGCDAMSSSLYFTIYKTSSHDFSSDYIYETCNEVEKGLRYKKCKNCNTTTDYQYLVEISMNPYYDDFELSGGGYFAPETKISVKAIVPDGYTFINWSGSKYSESQNFSFYMGKRAYSLVAKVKENKYKVTYTLNKGFVEGNPSEYTINSEITLKNPTKAGYEFIGWSREDGSPITMICKIDKGTKGNLHFIAHYRKDQVGDEFKTSTALYEITSIGASGDGEVLYKKSLTSKKSSELTIPSTITYHGKTFKVTEVKNGLFKNNVYLKKVKLGNYITKINDKMFYGCFNLKELSIGKYTEEIGNKAFKGCKALKEVTIPNKVKTIGTQSFMNCSKMTTLTIGNKVTMIGDSSFEGCKKLKVVTLGKNVSTISYDAFKNCKTLTKITIPSKVKIIDDGAFYNCKKLKSITIKSKKIYYIGLNSIKNIHKKAIIKVPKNKLKTYKNLFVNNTGYKKTMKIKK